MNKMVKVGMVVIATGLVGIGAMGATNSVTSSVVSPPTVYQSAFHFPIGPGPYPNAGG